VTEQCVDVVERYVPEESGFNGTRVSRGPNVAVIRSRTALSRPSEVCTIIRDHPHLRIAGTESGDDQDAYPPSRKRLYHRQGARIRIVKVIQHEHYHPRCADFDQDVANQVLEANTTLGAAQRVGGLLAPQSIWPHQLDNLLNLRNSRIEQMEILRQRGSAQPKRDCWLDAHVDLRAQTLTQRVAEGEDFSRSASEKLPKDQRETSELRDLDKNMSEYWLGKNARSQSTAWDCRPQTSPVPPAQTLASRENTLEPRGRSYRSFINMSAGL
jgi:hypothetical protein